MNGQLPEKKPPQNIEAEQCQLGCLMLDKNALVKVADFISADDFYKESHRQIYRAMAELFEKMEPIDIVSVSTRLKEKEKLEPVGGSSYLTSLINSVPTATHVANYAKIVREKKILRDLIEASQQIGLDAFDESQDIDILLDKAEKRVFGIGQKSLRQSFVPIKEMLAETFERIDHLSKRQGDLRGIPTGFKQLDNILAGMQRSDLVILAARPSMGKSSMALDIARNVAIFSNLPVGIFSLEMSKDQIVDRMIAGVANIDLWKIRTGRLHDGGADNDFTRIQSAMGTLS
ncbi:MAG: replicative DNA helicase, partial [Patescibacteria group bacterium]